MAMSHRGIFRRAPPEHLDGKLEQAGTTRQSQFAGFASGNNQYGVDRLQK
jgi:hypothetical protein